MVPMFKNFLHKIICNVKLTTEETLNIRHKNGKCKDSLQVIKQNYLNLLYKCQIRLNFAINLKKYKVLFQVWNFTFLAEFHISYIPR